VKNEELKKIGMKSRIVYIQQWSDPSASHLYYQWQKHLQNRRRCKGNEDGRSGQPDGGGLIVYQDRADQTLPVIALVTYIRPLILMKEFIWDYL
jgi:hypothetical protein